MKHNLAYATDLVLLAACLVWIALSLGPSPMAWAATLFTQQAKILASDAAGDDRFGDATAQDADTAVVGAKLDDHATTDAGSAYVFFRTAGLWVQQGKLVASDRQSYDQFGTTVAVSSDTAVVGGPFNDDVGGSTGSAYVFVRSGGTWSFSQKLLPNDPHSPAQFGYSIDIEGDLVVVGAPFDDDAGSSSGSAYVFERDLANNWGQRAKLTAGDADDELESEWQSAGAS